MGWRADSAYENAQRVDGRRLWARLPSRTRVNALARAIVGLAFLAAFAAVVLWSAFRW